MAIKHNWTREEILDIHDKPFMELLCEAATVHRNNPKKVQISTLLPLKTGGCLEDFGYEDLENFGQCPQNQCNGL
jgi:biotin synthase